MEVNENETPNPEQQPTSTGEGAQETGTPDNTGQPADTGGESGSEPGAPTEAPKSEDTDIFGGIAERTGFEIKSQDDLINYLSEYKDLKSKGDPFESLSPALRQALEYEQKGGDVRNVFENLSLNVDNLDEKGALWRKYITDNQSQYSRDPKFTRMKFEREFKDRYGILNEPNFEDEEEKEQWLAEHQDDLEYAKLALQNDVNDAKESLKSMQEKALQAPDDKPQPMSEEDILKWQQSAKQAVESLKEVNISLDEGVDFKYALDEEGQQQAMNYLQNPAAFFEEFGVTETIKMDKFSELVKKVVLADRVGKVAYKYGKEGHSDTKDALENKMTNPRDPGADPQGPKAQRLAESLAEKFRKPA